MKTTRAFDAGWYVPATRTAKEAEALADASQIMAALAPGHVYVIEFDTGVIKVGKTARPAVRMAAHAANGQVHGRSVRSSWLSPDHFCHGATERELIEFCARSGHCVAGREFFGGLRFAEVRNRASLLSANRIPYAADGDLAMTWQDAHDRLDPDDAA